MKTHRQAQQQGFTLISLLVGATLSMFSIIAMLTLYKNLIGNAAIATQDARQDGQVAAARMILQRDMQTAGYAMTATVNTDLVLMKNAALDTTTLSGQQISLPSSERGNALLWRYGTGNTSICQGVLSSGGALLSLSAASCSGSLASQAWMATPLIVSPQAGLNNLASFSSAVGDAAFSVNYQDCWPYQKDDRPLASHLAVSLQTNLTNSTSDSATYAEANLLTFCLPNFPRT